MTATQAATLQSLKGTTVSKNLRVRTCLAQNLKQVLIM